MDLRQRFTLWQVGRYEKKRDKATQRWLSCRQRYLSR